MLVEHTWRQAWVWSSIVVLVLVAGSMSAFGARPFNHVRHALGLPWFDGKGVQPGGGPEDHDEMRRRLDALRVWPMLVAGVGGYALLVWLMVMRPGA